MLISTTNQKRLSVSRLCNLDVCVLLSCAHTSLLFLSVEGEMPYFSLKKNKHYTHTVETRCLHTPSKNTHLFFLQSKVKSNQNSLVLGQLSRFVTTLSLCLESLSIWKTQLSLRFTFLDYFFTIST